MLQLACGRRWESLSLYGAYLSPLPPPMATQTTKWLDSGRARETLQCTSCTSLARSGVACPKLSSHYLMIFILIFTCWYIISADTHLFVSFRSTLTTLNWSSLVFQVNIQLFYLPYKRYLHYQLLKSVRAPSTQTFSTFSFAFSCLCTGNARLVQTCADKRCLTGSQSVFRLCDLCHKLSVNTEN